MMEDNKLNPGLLFKVATVWIGYIYGIVLILSGLQVAFTLDAWTGLLFSVVGTGLTAFAYNLSSTILQEERIKKIRLR